MPSFQWGSALEKGLWFCFLFFKYIFVGLPVALAFPGISLGVRTPGHKVGRVGEVEIQDTQSCGRNENCFYAVHG